MKFTPGPWKQETFAGVTNVWPVKPTASGSAVAYDVEENDARLIAAAPDLHEALRQIVMLDDDAHPGLATWQEARAKADAAAKAALKKVEE